jgi:hypothetical protein
MAAKGLREPGAFCYPPFMVSPSDKLDTSKLFRATKAELPDQGVLSGAQAYCTDGMKLGDAVGAGTGVPVYADVDDEGAVTWLRYYDDLEVETDTITTVLHDPIDHTHVEADITDLDVPPTRSISGFIFEHIKTDADATNLGVDGSTTSVNYDFTAVVECDLYRVNFTTHDNAAFDADGFFSIAALAGDGLLVQLLDANGVIKQHFGTNVIPITRHRHLYALLGIDINDDSAGATSASGGRWTIAKSGAAAHLLPGEKFRIVVADDLSAIAELEVMVQGIVTNE